MRNKQVGTGITSIGSNYVEDEKLNQIKNILVGCDLETEVSLDIQRIIC